MRKVLTCVSLLAALASCVRSAPPPEAKNDTTEERLVTLDVAGSVRVTRSSTLPIRAMRITQALEVLILQTGDWVPIGRGRSMKVGMAITEFKGDGPYPLSNNGKAPDGSAGSFSRGWIEVKEGDDPRSYRIYEIGTCNVRIVDEGDAGTMRCDRLRALEGGAVEVELAWEPPV